MSIKARYAKLLQSDIGKLTIDGKAVGLRLRVYDMELDKFILFDFAVSVIKSPELRKFLTENSKSFVALPLCVRKVTKGIVDGVEKDIEVLMTQEEADKNLLVNEFKSTEEAEAYLNFAVKVYKWKGDGVDV